MNSAKKKRKSRDFLPECVCISLKPVVHLISCDGALAQLARASHWQCEGQRFKSAMLHHFFCLFHAFPATSAIQSPCFYARNCGGGMTGLPHEVFTIPDAVHQLREVRREIMLSGVSRSVRATVSHCGKPGSSRSITIFSQRNGRF